jgi:hypothetical protein
VGKQAEGRGPPSRRTASPGDAVVADDNGRPPRRGLRPVALGVASVALMALLLYSLGTFNGPAATSSPTMTTSTSYSATALSVIASVAAGAPDGYAQGSSNQLAPSEPGLESGGFGTFFTQSGSVANATILVFDTPQSAQAYIDSVITNSKGLSGYADMTPALASYRQYGVCYGFGQADPDGNGAVATGVCNKGNVYIQVHVVSPYSVSSAEVEMSDLVGAAYKATG